MKKENPIRFGTDGWRATIAKEFTFDNAKIVVQAIADHINEQGQGIQGIVIGYDTRFMADEFAKLAAEVMTGNHIQVFLVQKPSPTPVIAHAVKQHDASGAIVFTASHNPAHYMGLKFIPDYAGPANTKITQRLEERIARIGQKGSIKATTFDHALATSRILMIDPDARYVADLKKLIRFDAIRSSRMSVVTDAMHGAGSGYVSGLLDEAFCEVIALHEQRDPLFGGMMPEPTVQHLGELRNTVLYRRADLGLANDGDADRFGIIDDKGNYLPPNLVMALLLHHLAVNRKQEGMVVRTVATTHLLDRIAEMLGLKVLETPVGFKYIGDAMLRENVLIGGEESGGLSIQGHLPEKDGILADLLIAEMCAMEGKPLSQLVDRLYEMYGRIHAVRLDLHTTEARKSELLQQFAKHPPQEFAGVKVDHVLTIDGHKFLLEDGSWVLVRPSGTEPLLRVYMEAGSEERLDALRTAVEGLVGVTLREAHHAS